ncbi:MAG: STAS domain-containing protein, partial [Pseudanabaena sp.]
FMDSSGLGALVSALKLIRNSNGEMVICAANDQVKMLFELTSMNKIFKIYPTIDEFNATIS